MKKLLPKRKPERKPSEEDFTVRKSKYATQRKWNPPLLLWRRHLPFLPRCSLVNFIVWRWVFVLGFLSCISNMAARGSVRCVCPPSHLSLSLRYSSSRGGRSDTESDRGLLHQRQDTTDSQLQWVHTHRYTHMLAASCLTANLCFSSALTMSLSSLFLCLPCIPLPSTSSKPFMNYFIHTLLFGFIILLLFRVSLFFLST